MLASEAIALRTMVGATRIVNETKNVFVVVAPQREAFGRHNDGIAHLCRFGEFMLNIEVPIDEVVLVLGGNTSRPGPYNAIPDEFMRYLELWSEHTQCEVLYDLIPCKNKRYFVGGFVGKNSDLFNSVLQRLNACDHSIVVGPEMLVFENSTLKSAWDDPLLKNLPSKWSDDSFMPVKMWWRGASGSEGGNEGELPPSPFCSFAGVYFRKGLERNPQSALDEPEEIIRRKTGLTFRGVNQYVCVVTEDGKVFRNRAWEMEVDPSDGYIAALLHLVPEIAIGSTDVKVRHRGMHPDVSMNSAIAWREAIVFIIDEVQGEEFVDGPSWAKQQSTKEVGSAMVEESEVVANDEQVWIDFCATHGPMISEMQTALLARYPGDRSEGGNMIVDVNLMNIWASSNKKLLGSEMAEFIVQVADKLKQVSVGRFIVDKLLLTTSL